MSKSLNTYVKKKKKFLIGCNGTNDGFKRGGCTG